MRKQQYSRESLLSKQFDLKQFYSLKTRNSTSAQATAVHTLLKVIHHPNTITIKMGGSVAADHCSHTATIFNTCFKN